MAVLPREVVDQIVCYLMDDIEAAPIHDAIYNRRLAGRLQANAFDYRRIIQTFNSAFLDTIFRNESAFCHHSKAEKSRSNPVLRRILISLASNTLHWLVLERCRDRSDHVAQWSAWNEYLHFVRCLHFSSAVPPS